ncbi:MAG: TIGR04282 family arsenosugar biosynthesis glycosyltransferase [Myxococcota bacterium]
MRPAALLFTRFPRPGSVKTRLAATVGEQLATEFYRRCVESVIQAVHGADVDVVVLVAEASDVAAVRGWLGSAHEVHAQVDGGLTERLTIAVQQAFDRGHPSVMVLASDTPELDAAVVRRAVDALSETDAVLGPALDGGYFLLGLTSPLPSVFEGISWSTAHVADETRARLAAAGQTWSELSPLADVDVEQDLRAYGRRAREGDPLKVWVASALPEA